VQSVKTRYGMTPEMWDATRERVRSFLVACARQRRTTTYSEVSEVAAPAHLPPYSYGMVAMLEEICTREEAARGVMLASLVCTKATGMPGDGYFVVAKRLLRDTDDRRAFWEGEVERVFDAFSGELS
jgi:hypothetical protein